MKNETIVLAPCKINLTLNITGKRNNGYHDMSMVMQTLDFYDKITIKKTNSSIINVIDKQSKIPKDNNSIVFRATTSFFQYTNIKHNGIEIFVEDNIPVCAGLAGGSADGAGVLVGLNSLFSANLSKQQLCEIGVQIGADIPFCIMGSTALVEGIGEIITPIKPLTQGFFVVAKPDWGVSTPEAFQIFDNAKKIHTIDNKKTIDAISTQNIIELGKSFANVFQDVYQNQEVDNLCSEFKDIGAIGACMTGSGSAVFAIFDSYNKAKFALDIIKNKYPSAFLARPCKFGARPIE